MRNKQQSGRNIILYSLLCLNYLFMVLMYAKLDIALADIPFILRLFIILLMFFFICLGMERAIWGIVVRLQRNRPQLYEFLVTKIFGPKQLIFIGSITLAIPIQIGILLFSCAFISMSLDINFHISVPPARELLLSVINVLSTIFKSITAFMTFALYVSITSILLIIKGNDQLKAIEQNPYYSPQVMYPPIQQQR